MTTLQTGMHYPIDLDTLPESWEKGYVGDFAVEIRPGFASGQHNKEGRGIPHIRPFNIDRRGTLDLTQIKSVAPDADAKRLHTGDVLFNNTNSPELIGKTSFIAVAGEWGFSNHMTRLVFPDAVSPRFAAYQLHYLWMRGYFLHNCVKHVNQASVSSSTLARTVPFVNPPRPQQDSIVAEIEKQFSRLDEAIANLKRVKANLKRYKAATLKAAVEGKLTEDWRKQHPNVQPASKLLERILAERRAKWNGRGKYKEPVKPAMTEPLFLPEKWIWTTVEQLTAMVTSGSRGWGEYYSNTGPLFIRAQDIKTDSLNLPNVARVMIPHNAEGTRTAVSKGDVLITITGANVTKSALVRELKEEAFVSQHVALLKPCLTTISTYLFTWVVAPTHGRKTLERWAYGAGKPGLSLEQVRSLPVALPPLAEQIQMADEVERRLSVIDELEATVEANLTRADRLRQSILSDAFAGKLVCSNGNQSDKRSTDIQMAKA